tara:strand:+ start:739 stop:963 length:225 start_codon:yes stop_codon:yes gene_type:complete
MSIHAEEDFINAFMDTAHRWSSIDELVPDLALMIKNSVREGVTSAEYKYQSDAPDGAEQELIQCIMAELKREIL